MKPAENNNINSIWNTYYDQLLNFILKRVSDKATAEQMKSIFNTFKLFKKDIAIMDRRKRTRNVKSIQQFPAVSQIDLSSPLDSACRLKYVLEFFMLERDIGKIYTMDDLKLADFLKKPK